MLSQTAHYFISLSAFFFIDFDLFIKMLPFVSWEKKHYILTKRVIVHNTELLPREGSVDVGTVNNLE